jgi:ABC-2 type transport system permease protein
MTYAASSISAIRRDEAEGYIDNILVRPVSRMRWLLGRISLTLIVIILAGFLLSAGTWLGIANQHLGISFNSLLQAGANAIVPVLFTLGVGVFAFGIFPRLTSLLAYAVVAWSFLIEMISSGIHISHWVLDTSILNHTVFAPAALPNWTSNIILISIAVVLSLIGLVVFNNRDLASE